MGAGYIPNYTSPIKFEDSLVTRTHDTRHKGAIFTVTNSTTQNLDIALDADMNFLYGGRIDFYSWNAGQDYFTIQTVDIDNVLGYGAGFVLAANFKNIPVNKEGSHDFASKFLSAELPPGLYCRMIYTSTGTTDVIVNWTLYGRKKP